MANKDLEKGKLEDFTRQIAEMYRYCRANNIDPCIVCAANEVARCRVALEVSLELVKEVDLVGV